MAQRRLAALFGSEFPGSHNCSLYMPRPRGFDVRLASKNPRLLKRRLKRPCGNLWGRRTAVGALQRSIARPSTQTQGLFVPSL